MAGQPWYAVARAVQLASLAIMLWLAAASWFGWVSGLLAIAGSAASLLAYMGATVWGGFGRVNERFDDQDGHLARLVEGQGNMLGNQERMLFNQERVLLNQERMLLRQDAMLGKQDQMLGKQDQMLDGQDRMLGKQDVSIDLQHKAMDRFDALVRLHEDLYDLLDARLPTRS